MAMNYTVLQQWVQWLIGVDRNLLARMTNVETRLNAMSKEFDDLKAAFENYQTEVNTDLGALAEKVQQLTDLVNTTPNDTAAMTELTTEINSLTSAAHAKYQPPAPTPEPTPAPTNETPPTDGTTPSA